MSKNKWKNILLLGAALLASQLLVGCLEPADDGDEATTYDESCEMCHSLESGSATHVAHVSRDMMSTGPLACGECHPTDREWLETLHQNGTVETSFASSTLASAEGLEPVMEDGTCSNVYCHGVTLSGGTNTEPNWSDEVDDTCGMCHGEPPTENHPLVETCDTCHSAAYTDGVHNENHINGVVDLSI